MDQSYFKKLKASLYTEPSKNKRHIRWNYKVPVYALIEKIGIPCVRGRDPDCFVWNGEVLRPDLYQRASDVIHEIAHWLAATDEMRKHPEYGLGRAPDTFCKASIIFPYKKITYEENLASILGILIERELGYNWYDTLGRHAWRDTPWRTDEKLESELFGLFTELCNRGVLNKKGQVLCLL